MTQFTGTTIHNNRLLSRAEVIAEGAAATCTHLCALNLHKLGSTFFTTEAFYEDQQFYLFKLISASIALTGSTVHSEAQNMANVYNGVISFSNSTYRDSSFVRNALLLTRSNITANDLTI